MGVVCGTLPPTIVVTYGGREYTCVASTAGTFESAKAFVEFAQWELRLRDAIGPDVCVRLFWQPSGAEVCDSDFEDSQALRRARKKRGLSVRAERSAENDAEVDKYAYEVELSEQFASMLLAETKRISDAGRPKHLAMESKSPEFNSRKFRELESTLRNAGATTEVNSLVSDVRRAMAENVQKINKVAILAQQVYERFPMVARGLRSSDTVYLTEAVNYQRKNLECIQAVIDEACNAIDSLRESLGQRQSFFEWAASARATASSVGMTTCVVVPSTDALLTCHALNVGAQTASQNPFTAWLTSSSLRRHVWQTPGGLLQGPVVHTSTTVVPHFHVAAFACSGGISLALMGGLAALVYHRWKRMSSWHETADMVAGAIEALQANDDYWQGLCFPRDQLDLLLQQVIKESNPTSHHAITAWKTIVRITAMLITAIDTYLVWLDLAGWVPASIPLQTRLQRRYPMLVQMLGAEVDDEIFTPGPPEKMAMLTDLPEGGDARHQGGGGGPADDSGAPADVDFWKY